MKTIPALSGGLAGACALTIIHEIARKIDPDAPRMDVLGMEAITKIFRLNKANPPDNNILFNITMAGDLISNTLYYSLIGLGNKKRVAMRGILFGLGAGLAAVCLPKRLGLNEAPSNRSQRTQLMTISWYLAGGLVAAASNSLLQKNKYAK